MPKAMMLGGKGTGCGCSASAPAPGTGRLGKLAGKALRAGSYKGRVGVVIEGSPRTSGVGGLGRGSHCAKIHGEVRCFRTERALKKALRRAHKRR